MPIISGTRTIVERDVEIHVEPIELLRQLRIELFKGLNGPLLTQGGQRIGRATLVDGHTWKQYVVNDGGLAVIPLRPATQEEIEAWKAIETIQKIMKIPIL